MLNKITVTLLKIILFIFNKNRKIYYFKNKPYSIFSNTKIKINNKWIDAVIYITEYNHKDGIFFVRTVEDFNKNFKTK